MPAAAGLSANRPSFLDSWCHFVWKFTFCKLQMISSVVTQECPGRILWVCCNGNRAFLYGFISISKGFSPFWTVRLKPAVLKSRYFAGILACCLIFGGASPVTSFARGGQTDT